MLWYIISLIVIGISIWAVWVLASDVRERNRMRRAYAAAQARIAGHRRNR